MLNVEQWAEIRRLHRVEGMSIRAISQRLGVARETVTRAVRAKGPPVYRRRVSTSSKNVPESSE
jgi:transposase